MANTDHDGERGSTPEQAGEHYDRQGQGQYPGRQSPGTEFPPNLYDTSPYQGNPPGYSGMYGGAQYGQAPYEVPRVPGARYGAQMPGAESWRLPGPYVGRGPRSYRRSDERICEDVCDRLTQAGQLDATDIEVQVSNGEVTLAGQVDSRESKHMAEDIAVGVLGVRDVHNQLKVPEGPVNKATDTRTLGSQGH